MPLHFAAARPAYCALAGRRLTRRVATRAANDNGSDLFASDALQRAARRHALVHGPEAAAHAHDLAERAFFAGDSDTYRWWLGVSRTLDRTAAHMLAARSAGANDAESPFTRERV
ncbi:hypothetical protein ACOYW6_06870 [Parablastomonas sp. CN1-191]|uniref:hypothetical protein n=1 Tax=Parablastomonas sp. CN1-191 TaxID=3400908 RepID=UPI003BF89BE4